MTPYLRAPDKLNKDQSSIAYVVLSHENQLLVEQIAMEALFTKNRILSKPNKCRRQFP